MHEPRLHEASESSRTASLPGTRIRASRHFARPCISARRAVTPRRHQENGRRVRRECVRSLCTGRERIDRSPQGNRSNLSSLELACDAGDAIQHSYDFGLGMEQFQNLEEAGVLGRQARDYVGYTLRQPGRRFGANILYRREIPGELPVPGTILGVEFPVAPGTHLPSLSTGPTSYHYLELVGSGSIDLGMVPTALQNYQLPVATTPSALGLREAQFIPVGVR